MGLADPTSSFRQGSRPRAYRDKLWAGIQAVGIGTCRKSGFRPEARRNDGKGLIQESIEPLAKVLFTLRYLRANGLLQPQRVEFPFVVSEVSPPLAWQSVSQETVPTMWVLFLERYRTTNGGSFARGSIERPFLEQLLMTLRDTRKHMKRPHSVGWVERSETQHNFSKQRTQGIRPSSSLRSPRSLR
jgi:hypothetical protein